MRSRRLPPESVITVPDSGDEPVERSEPGRTIGRFVIERELGSGGMGIVYAARDPVLDRRVAIKLIRPGVAGETRLLREAQAMARLTDPNVVTVHEAGVAGGEIYVAMELVDGMTLREWSAREPRAWRDIVAVYLSAGRGLVAAHDAGMVHRDFKPANVFIDGAGRVKVGDFGLVGASSDEDLGTGPSALSATVTNTGSVLGTPAYMAPEQKRGEEVDSRADQYAYCKSLDEALDAAREPEPARLRTIVKRGLAEDPARRYPSMRGLLHDLELVMSKRRRVVTAVAALAIAGGAAGAVALLAHDEAPDPCGNLDDRLAGVWDAAQKGSVRATLVAADPQRGAARFDAVVGILDPYASSWRAMQLEACRANRVTHAESDTLHDRRVACLERRREEMVAAVGALREVRDKPAVDRAIAAANRVSDLRACADAPALLAAVPPPENPDARREADAITAELDAINQARIAARLDELDKRSAAALDRARKLGHAPTTAEALKVRIEVSRAGSVHAGEVDLLHELTEVAAAAHDDHLAAWAWGDLLMTTAYDLEKPADAVVLLPAGRAALAGASGDPLTRANFLYSEGTVLALAGKVDEGLTKLDEAEKQLTGQGAKYVPRLADIVLQQGILRAQAGRYAEAEPLLRRSIELYTHAYGADHPEAASSWGSLAFVLRRQSKGADALAADRESVRIRAARTGDTPLVANAMVSLAYNLMLAQQVAEARTTVERAIAILRKTDDASTLATALMTAGTVYEAAKDPAAAAAAYDEAIAMFEARAPDNVNLPISLLNRGTMTTRAGKCEAALVDLRRSLDLFVKKLGDKHPNLAYPWTGIGRCLVELGRFEEAEPHLSRALELGPNAPKDIVAFAKFYRARALVDSGRDRAGGLTAAKAARAELAQLGDSVSLDLPGIDAWLAKR